jgi:hypothetical protein
VSQDQEPEAEHEHSQMLRHLLSSFVQYGSSSAGSHRQQQQRQASGIGRFQSWITGFRHYVTHAGQQVGTTTALQQQQLNVGQLPGSQEEQRQQQQQDHGAAGDISVPASKQDPCRSSVADGGSTESGSSKSSSGSNEADSSSSSSSSTEASDVPVFQRQQQQQQQQQQQLGAGLQRAHSTRSLPGPDELRSLSTVSAPASYWNLRNMLPVTNNVINTNYDMFGNMLHDMGDCEELWEDAHSLAALPMLPASLVGATIHHAGITGVLA